MNKKKITAFTLSAMMALTALGGCGANKTGGTAGKWSKVTTNGAEIYPVSCDDTLTYWMNLNPMLSGDFENFGEIPLAKELEKETGIKVEYIHAQPGQEKEQFNLMISSNELPDMVQYSWNNYPGGADLAIKEETIVALNEYLPKYAPNMNKYFSENSDVDKKVKTDSGNYFTVPFIRSADWLCTYQGIILRADWLKKAGLSEPKTLDEFDTMLNEFKKFSSGQPLFLAPLQRNFVMNAYGIENNFYLDGDTVKYGPMQPEYKDVIAKFKQWYDNGILDKDFATADSKYQTAAILNGKTGVYYGAIVGGMGVRLDAKPADVPEYDLQGITQVSKDGAEIPEYSYMEDNVNLSVGTSISANCKNIELAMRYLDFGFTEKGNKLYNFGIEGESYTMVDGKETLTPLLTKNPEGLSISKVAPRYLRASYNGPFVQGEGYVRQSLAHPQRQQEAYDKWSKTNMKKHIMPPVTLLPDELTKSSDINANIKTYVDEMFIKFVTGTEPLENFDAYLAQLESFGINDLLKMKQDALERYNKR